VVSPSRSISCCLLVETFLAKKGRIARRCPKGAADRRTRRASSPRLMGPPSLRWVVNDELRAVANVSVGDPVTVCAHHHRRRHAVSGWTRTVLSVPSTLQQAFEGATDTSQLLPGQTGTVAGAQACYDRWTGACRQLSSPPIASGSVTRVSPRQCSGWRRSGNNFNVWRPAWLVHGSPV